LPESYLHNLDFLFLFAGIVLLAGILSGSYVSFYLSGFRPIDVLRSKLSTGGARVRLRRIMISIQMVIFVGLIVASITIYRQVLFFQDKDMGFDRRDLVVLTTQNRNLATTFETFKAELKSNPSILSVSGADLLPGAEGGGYSTIPDKSDPSRNISYQALDVDRDFIEAMKMTMVDGKSFAEMTPEQSRNAVIINESAMKAFRIGEFSQELVGGRRILGIVRDFNMHSLRATIAPVVLHCTTQYLHEICVRVQHSSDFPTVVKFIEGTSRRFNGGMPMSSQLFDERLDGLYGDEYRFGQMIGCFTALAIFIACLGLFGVSLFVIQSRVKEVGIRKVMGASAGAVFYLLVKEFIFLILLSTVISIPIAMYCVDGWLKNYAYRVSVDIFVVALALLAAMVIVLATVGYQAMRVATANPVEALRYE
jgi:putative ABC transport system permease protein